MRKTIFSLAMIALAFIVAFASFGDAAARRSTAVRTFPIGNLKLVAEGFAHPVAVKQSPDRTGRLFVVDQTGQIWIITKAGQKLPQPFLDIADKLAPLSPGYDERGLLGLAFHPNYATNGRFFVFYGAPLRPGAPAGYNHTNVISEFHVSAGDANVADESSEIKLLEMDHPYMNHNGGDLHFGKDGYLYISVGDGGNKNDIGLGHVEDWYAVNEGGNAQDIGQNLMGSILRLDVNSGAPYGIPADNPFVGLAGALPEHWAYGFRNPYRFSFDMLTGWMLVGDAGQVRQEEISKVRKGGNYGWNVWEGIECFNAADETMPLPSCPGVVGAGHPRAGDPLIGPVINLKHSSIGGLGNVIVGGYVYRGNKAPYLRGNYIFAMFSQGADASGTLQPGLVLLSNPRAKNKAGRWQVKAVRFQNMNGFPYFVLGFGQDLKGEVYILTTSELGPVGTTGKVYMITPLGRKP